MLIATTPTLSFYLFPPLNGCNNINLAHGVLGLIFIHLFLGSFLRVGDYKGNKDTLMIVVTGCLE